MKKPIIVIVGITFLSVMMLTSLSTLENIPNGGPGKSRPVAPQAKLATAWGKLKMK